MYLQENSPILIQMIRIKSIKKTFIHLTAEILKQNSDSKQIKKSVENQLNKIYAQDLQSQVYYNFFKSLRISKINLIYMSEFIKSIYQSYNLYFKMNRLQLPHAKLFYTISELYKKKLISDDEKRILKEKTISDDLQIFQILDKYQKNKNEADLTNNLINLIRNKGFNLILTEIANDNIEKNIENNQQKPQQKQTITNNQQYIFNNPNIPEEVSSPWGEFLRRKKAKQQHGQNLQQIKNLIQPHNAGS